MPQFHFLKVLEQLLIILKVRLQLILLNFLFPLQLRNYQHGVSYYLYFPSSHHNECFHSIDAHFILGYIIGYMKKQPFLQLVTAPYWAQYYNSSSTLVTAPLKLIFHPWFSSTLVTTPLQLIFLPWTSTLNLCLEIQFLPLPLVLLGSLTIILLLCNPLWSFEWSISCWN